MMQASPTTCFSPKSFITRKSPIKESSYCLGFANPRPISTPKLSFDASKRKSVIVEARKKKEDSHSFVARPDEATGPYPEAVLLRKKKVQEDGKVVPEFADVEEEQLFELLNLQLESDLNVDRMRHYEVVYLIHEHHVDEVQSITSKVEEFVREKKGKTWRLNNWGIRRLPYKIKKAKNANYILMNFELAAKWVNDFKSMLDKDERIIRHLLMKKDEAETEDCPPPPEFHTLHANGMEDDGDDEYHHTDNDKSELQTASCNDGNDIENGVIFFEDDDDGND